jgi:2-polyprenyl-3-methyl-5-hydroxy-6-metoxy-1,4-benzoquinol methylase
MEAMQGLLCQRRANATREVLGRTGLYHSFRLPDGSILLGGLPIELLEERLRSFQLPENLQGKRVLDIGPWDGYFTFEMERRGAEVVGIDYVDLDTFRALQSIFGSRACYLQEDVYELDPRRHGLFDIVLFLGVLYHLKHPLLALEQVCAVTKETCIIDTFVVDGKEWQKGIALQFHILSFMRPTS